MKVFLDTNVLVDYLNKREPFFEDAASIIGICLSGQVKGVLSALSVVNAAYIMRKAYTKDSLMAKMEWLATAFEISPINRQTIHDALTSRAADFEDAVQCFSAVQSRSDLILTRDKSGFNSLVLPVMTPAEFLARCAE